MDTALASSFCGTVTSFIRVFLLPPSQQSCEEFLSGSNKHLQSLPLSFSLSRSPRTFLKRHWGWGIFVLPLRTASHASRALCSARVKTCRADHKRGHGTTDQLARERPHVCVHFPTLMLRQMFSPHP